MQQKNGTEAQREVSDTVSQTSPEPFTGSRFLQGKIADPLGKGARAVAFIEKLKHTEGPLAGEQFRLHAWQSKIVRKVFGDVDARGRRRIRTVFMLLPRGNGKTTLTSGLGLLTTVGPERDAAGQTVCAAADREQASIAFNAACRMVRADDNLARITRIVDSRRSIFHPKSNSVYRAISHEAYSKHGLNVSTLLADEIHAWPTRELWDVLVSSMGKRQQPLTIITTTAGCGRTGIAWELYAYALRVERGEVDDPSFLPVLYQAPPDADWQDEKIWRAVNPAIAAGFRSLEEMQISARRAAESPMAREAFKRLYLNQWSESMAEPWLEMSVYDECAGAPVTLDDLRDKPCYIGVDLASVQDLAAVVVAARYNGGWIVWARQYCPEAAVRKRSAAGLPYLEWQDAGELVATAGNSIDQDLIYNDVLDLCRELDVRKIGVDRWGATGFMRRLMDRELPVVEFGQGFASMTAPCREIERSILERKFRHGGNRLLRWNFANIRPEIDAAANVKFSKSKSAEKIDGAAACAMAIGVALTDDGDGELVSSGMLY
jgi:phage terminase large subunit-like protein